MRFMLKFVMMPIVFPLMGGMVHKLEVGAKRFGSLKESMDEFRFRELAEHMEKRDFASFVRAETV